MRYTEPHTDKRASGERTQIHKTTFKKSVMKSGQRSTKAKNLDDDEQKICKKLTQQRQRRIKRRKEHSQQQARRAYPTAGVRVPVTPLVSLPPGIQSPPKLQPRISAAHALVFARLIAHFGSASMMHVFAFARTTRVFPSYPARLAGGPPWSSTCTPPTSRLRSF